MPGLPSPLGLQEVEAPRISRQFEHKDGQVVSLSAGRPYPAGNIPCNYFCQTLSRTQWHTAAGRINLLALGLFF